MRYAGFWPRFRAGWIDFLVTLPFLLLAFWVEGFSRHSAILAELAANLPYACYVIYFHGRYGQTIGKMAVGVKVVDLTGADIRFR